MTPLPPPSLVTTAASVNGGDPIRVTYTPSQPRDYSRDLLLSSTSAAVRVEPASVTVAAGASSITFDISTDRVPVKTAVTLSAEMDGVTSTVELQLLPPLAQLAAFSVAPARVRGGGDASGLVALSAAAPPEGTVVTLAATRDAEVPATFTIAPGATTGTFRIVTRPPYARTTVIITATVTITVVSAPVRTKTLPFVGSDESSFVVPAGVTSLTIAAYGAAGGAGTDGTAGGLGGRTTVTVRVTPGETLRVLVGGQSGAGGPAVRGTAGVIGGGAGGLDGLASGGGGGSSYAGGGATGVVHTQGIWAGHGQVVITW